MKKEDAQVYLNKKVKIFLKNNYVYTGYIISIAEESLQIEDKYFSLVTISLDQISSIISINEDNSYGG